MRSTTLRVSTTLVLALAAVSMVAAAEPAANRSFIYDVTITNLTQDQVISPPVVATHRGSTGIFTPGESASTELRMLAEDGLVDPLVMLLEDDPDVLSVAAAPGPVMPGESVTLQVHAFLWFDELSAVGMLVTTNDAFFGVDSHELGRFPFLAPIGPIFAPAYDAGTEANNENCGFIPGPPCGNPGVPDTDGAEGFISVHPGIHGVGDLDAAVWDWRNPVAKITVTRAGH